MRTWSSFHWKSRFIIWFSQITVAEKLINSYRLLSRKNELIDFHKLLSRRRLVEREKESNYSISRAARNWTNLFLTNDFVKSSIIIWSIDT
jgi:hypothetical protein